jgi:hypothetical protein
MLHALPTSYGQLYSQEICCYCYFDVLLHDIANYDTTAVRIDPSHQISELRSCMRKEFISFVRTKWLKFV